jgi:hypothetical protein
LSHGGSLFATDFSAHLHIETYFFPQRFW